MPLLLAAAPLQHLHLPFQVGLDEGRLLTQIPISLLMAVQCSLEQSQHSAYCLVG